MRRAVPVLVFGFLLLAGTSSCCPGAGGARSDARQTDPAGESSSWVTLDPQRREITSGWAVVFRSEIRLEAGVHPDEGAKAEILEVLSNELAAKGLGALLAVNDPAFLANLVAACNTRVAGSRVLEVRFADVSLEESMPVSSSQTMP